MKPVIGIIKSSNIIYHLCGEIEYILALKNCGAEVRFVKNVDEALLCDGLLFTGGSDITPSFYGEEREEKCGKTNLKRDKIEKNVNFMEICICVRWKIVVYPYPSRIRRLIF